MNILIVSRRLELNPAAAGKTGSSMERRKYPRVDVKFKVTLAFAGGQLEGKGQMLNLSEGGCAVKGDKRIPEKAMLH